jgi:hypothetical protein
MNGLTALGILLFASGGGLLLLTIFMATYVTSPYSISGGALSICIMMMVGGIVLGFYGAGNQ